MKSTVVQLGLIILLAVAGGTIYNIALSGNPQKHLKWMDPDRYPLWNKIGEPEPGSLSGGTPPASPSGDGNVIPAKAAPGTADPGKPATGAVPEPAKPPSEFPMIDIQAALDELESGATFIDARRTREYEVGHITGAIPISAWESDLTDKITKLVQGGEVLEAPVVIYCGSSKECEDSKMVATQLKAAGFLNILIYGGGFPEWEAKMPAEVTRGKEPGVRGTAGPKKEDA